DELALSIPGDLDLVATGTGTGASGELDLLVAGAALDQEVVIRAQLESTDGSGVAIEGTGEVAGGTITVNGSLSQAGWAGDLSIRDAELGPLVAHVEGTISGAITSPSLAVRGELIGPEVAAQVTGEVSLSAQVVEAVIDSDLLTTPLAVRALI